MGQGGSGRALGHRRRRGVPPFGPPSPPLQTKVTVVGNHKIYTRENLVGPFLVHKLLGLRRPLSPPSNTSLPSGLWGCLRAPPAVLPTGRAPGVAAQPTQRTRPRPRPRPRGPSGGHDRATRPRPGRPNPRDVRGYVYRGIHRHCSVDGLWSDAPPPPFGAGGCPPPPPLPRKALLPKSVRTRWGPDLLRQDSREAEPSTAAA